MITTSRPFEALYWTLNENWSHYQVHLRNCQKKPKAKEVHDLRTTLRRLRAAFDLVLELDLPHPHNRLRAHLKKELHLLRNLRDFQVQEKLMDERLKPSELEGFRTSLAKRKKQEQKIVLRALNNINSKKQRKDLQELNEELLDRSTNPLLERRARQAFERTLMKHYQQLRHCAQHAVASQPMSIHQTRIEFKKFRYTWEAISLLYPCHMSEQTEEKIKEAQTVLGDIQDSVVLTQLLYEYIVKSGQSHPDPNLLEFLRSVEKKQEEQTRFFLNHRNEMIVAIQPEVKQLPSQAA